MQAIQTLLGQAETQRDTALAAMRDAEHSAERTRTQASQLRDYRAEYQQRWATQFTRPSAIEIVQCYRSFMERLDQAIAQQQRACDMAEQNVLLARSALTDCELRVASVRKLLERRDLEAKAQSSRLDQRRTDEAGQRAAWARLQQSNTSMH